MKEKFQVRATIVRGPNDFIKKKINERSFVFCYIILT